jgi:uncharacterized protein YdhG (YjbR/CyaY superfamily)
MAKNKKTESFTDEERAAMAERVKELRGGPVLGEKPVLDKIATMQEPDRSIAKRIHELVKETAPELKPRTWYGMPAYTNKEGKVICFFQSGKQYQSRYCTFGFQDSAKLDEGNMWPTGFALEKLTPTEEKQIADLVRKAIS